MSSHARGASHVSSLARHHVPESGDPCLAKKPTQQSEVTRTRLENNRPEWTRPDLEDTDRLLEAQRSREDSWVHGNAPNAEYNPSSGLTHLRPCSRTTSQAVSTISL